MQTSSLLRLQSETVHCKKEPVYWVVENVFLLWFPQFFLLSSLRHLATPGCDLDQPGWICRRIPLQHGCPADTYLCKIYYSPPGIVCMIISMKTIWEYLSKQIHMQISNDISLNSDEPQAHTHNMHVLPPKVTYCISASDHFHKSWHMFPKFFHC